jgi:phage terminase large subunit-like protein
MSTKPTTRTSTKTRYNEQEAEKAVRFFPTRLVHTKGRWAGHPFKLADWQADRIIRPLFGEQVFDQELRLWVRRFRTSYVEIPRKNGKSELGAGIALKLLFADGENGAEVYSVAQDLDQANIVFAVAKAMIEANPALSKRAKVYKRVIEVTKTGNIYKVIPGDASGSHGLNIHGLIFDELHTQKTRELWDVMTSGQGARTQPLTVAFSTAGVFGESEICREIHEYGEKLDRGAHKDPTFHYVRYGLSEDPDVKGNWHDEKVWERCNPALGDFLSRAFLRSEYAKAVASPARENTYRRLYLNEWTQQLTRWMSLQKWDATGGMVDESSLQGRRCFGGLDLANTTDIAALCWDFPSEEEHEAIWRFWIPEERLADLDRRTGGQASVWARQGFLTTTEGDVIDHKAILKQIDHDARKFDVQELAYDRWGMTQLIQDIQEEGMTVVPFGQGFASMSGPTKEWERLILEKKYRHGGNPVMRWMVDNIVVRTDPAGNIKIDKQKSHEKVDGPVAAVMALDRATRHEAPKRSKVPVGF